LIIFWGKPTFADLVLSCHYSRCAVDITSLDGVTAPKPKLTISPCRRRAESVIFQSLSSDGVEEKASPAETEL